MNSNISKNLSIYLNNIFNFKEIDESLYTAFELILQELILGKRIDISFKKTMNDYPKYPYYYKYITSLSNYNVLKIREVTLDSVEKLINSIDSSAIGLKPTLDVYPKLKDDLVFDINLQLSYLTSQKDLYDINKFFLNYYGQSEFDNLFFYNMGKSIDSNIDSAESIQMIIMMYYLNRLIQRSSDIKTQLSAYLVTENSFSKNNISIDFNNFIELYTNDISTDLTNSICKNIYNMITVTDIVKDYVKTTIYNNISILTQNFENFMQDIGDQSTIDIDKNIRDCIYQIFTIELLKETANPTNSILNNLTESGFSDSLGRNEEQIIENYLNKISKHNIKSYLFLSYIYKFWPIKFLNILSIIIKRFIEEEIIDNSEIYLTDSKIKSYMQYFQYNCINMNQLLSTFTTYMNNSKVLELLDTYKAINFSTNQYFIGLFDKFLDSKYFENSIITILKEVNDTLYKNGFIQYGLNYYNGYYLIKLYFKVLFRNKIYSEELFGSLVNELKDNITSVFTNIYPSTIIDETPDGNINGVNTIFTTNYQFDDSTLVVTVNNITTNDYISDGTTNYISFNFVPQPGDIILVNYSIQYLIEYNYDLSILTNELDKLISSSVAVQEINIFLKNLYLGSVTKKAYYDSLSYFLI